MKSFEWIDRKMYPFASNFHEVKGGKMHYIDVGTGPTLVFVHGTPVWSFVYRNVIRKLTQSYRCIAIDHIGFGMSEKPGGERASTHLSNSKCMLVPASTT